MILTDAEPPLHTMPNLKAAGLEADRLRSEAIKLAVQHRVEARAAWVRAKERAELSLIHI